MNFYFYFYVASLVFCGAGVVAQKAGSISVVGETLVSAMMMMVGNDEKVYMIDKVEGNPTQIAGHPAWAVVWDIATSKATPIPMSTNAFCSSGMHLPNGSFATFGGNKAIGPGPVDSPPFNSVYGDYDGALAIRMLTPCTNAQSSNGNCNWYDNSSTLAMQRKRWYSAAEPLADGSVAIIGGFVDGGYINRFTPNVDPTYEAGEAEPTTEFFPANGQQPQVMDFMTTTSGLNSYAHTFLMKSGKMFLQANLSTVLWDPASNNETPLPPMPNGVVRVYPASGAVAMLPLTPANNYTPTILFCGGNNMPDAAYGNYDAPADDPWTYGSSNDCQRITPEPQDGSAPVYVQDDFMLDPRTMGQFVLLPDGTVLIVNGARNGTAGYGQTTGQTTTYGAMPYGMSFATNPVYTPAIYNPLAPAGSRWTDTGLQASVIPRLYHSSAILLPDASVLIAGSNPNADYNISTLYPTEYRAEIFYPLYWGKTRSNPQGVPTTLTYGGNYFNVTLSQSDFEGDANAAAGNTSVVLMRPGFTTHAMNMGQRMVQLNNTFTVSGSSSAGNSSGVTITLHVSQVPPFPTLLQPGPVFLYVVINGVPSKGTYILVGNGNIGTQPVAPVQDLPPSTLYTGQANGSGANTDTTNGGTTGTGFHLTTGVMIGAGAALVAVAAVAGVFITICLRNRKQAQKGLGGGFIAPDKNSKYSDGSLFSQGDIALQSSPNSYSPDPDGNDVPLGRRPGFDPYRYSYASHSESVVPLRHFAQPPGAGGGGTWGSNRSAMTSTASLQSFDPYALPPPVGYADTREFGGIEGREGSMRSGAEGSMRETYGRGGGGEGSMRSGLGREMEQEQEQDPYADDSQYVLSRESFTTPRAAPSPTPSQLQSQIPPVPPPQPQEFRRDDIPSPFGSRNGRDEVPSPFGGGSSMSRRDDVPSPFGSRNGRDDMPSPFGGGSRSGSGRDDLPSPFGGGSGMRSDDVPSPFGGGGSIRSGRGRDDVPSPFGNGNGGGNGSIRSGRSGRDDIPSPFGGPLHSSSSDMRSPAPSPREERDAFISSPSFSPQSILSPFGSGRTRTRGDGFPSPFGGGVPSPSPRDERDAFLQSQSQSQGSSMRSARDRR